jgi:hypothetical protein
MHQPFSASNTPIKPLPLSVSIASSATMPNTSQFRHTTLWNNVCANLNKKLVESALADTNSSSNYSSNVASLTAMHDSTNSNSNANSSFFYSSNHSRTSHSNFKLRKQHSRFVAASVVSGMLNIKENFTLSSNASSATTPSHSYTSTFSALNLTKTPMKSRANIQITTTTTVNQENFINNCNSNNTSPNIYFTGSQCVDIVFAYLSGNEHNHTFESGPVTREKATKVRGIFFDNSF